MRYNWQHPEWPNFIYDLSDVQETLYNYVRETAFLMGGVSQFSDEIQIDTGIDFMVSEALKTSEIEGEKFDDEDVRSSIRKELGLLPSKTSIKDLKAIGIGQLVFSVRKTFNDPLTEEELFKWHRMIMLGVRNQEEIGCWRKDHEPMQIVSGAIGHEKVHFEAPPSDKVPQEMERFIKWFNQTRSYPGVVRAAISHLYFESIHPFSDGNGRMGRAIAEKALSQDLGRPILFSLSTEIMKNKKKYYAELSLASQYNMNITHWVNYFVEMTYEAQMSAQKQVFFTLQKTKFWSRFKEGLNSRQEMVIQRMFKAGFTGFKGGMSAKKYMKIANCSKPTATRDLKDLLEKGCLTQLPGGGRSTSYEIALPQLEIKRDKT